MEFNIRKIELNDYYKGYFDLLSQLTFSNKVEFEIWENQLNQVNNNPYHNIFVIEHKNKIIGSITLLIELKIIRGVSKVSHIEDVIISNEYRGKGLAKKLIEYCINLSKLNKCYKIILNCDEKLFKFYSKFGFEKKNIEMSLYLH
jgi:glucosamine-phosphate N-acetyltransferase